MLRILLATAISLLLAAGCSSGDGSVSTGTPDSPNGPTAVPVTSVPRPPSVPDAAVPIETTTTLGRIERRAGADPQGIMTRDLNAADCQADVIVLETSLETIYATLPCDSFWDAEAEALFVEKEIAFVLDVTGQRFHIVFETLDGAQGEFTPSGIWVLAA